MKPYGLKNTGYIAKKHLEIPHFLRKKLKSSEFFHATGYLQKNHLSIPRLLDFPGYQRMIFLWVPYKCFFMCNSKALGVLRYKKIVYTPPMSAAVERFWILSYHQHNSKKGAILIEKASAVHLLRPNDVQRMLCRIFYPVAVFRYLFCAVDSVAGVAETRKDVAVLVEAFVLSADVNVYVRVCIC